VVALVLVLALAAVGGVAWQRRNGRMRAPRPGSAGAGEAAGTGLPLTARDLGTPLGARATLLQFSSSFCAPCRATRRTLADLAASNDGVTHVELDVADRLDLVRRLDVRRTPTVFVLGPDGRVTRQASGEPRRADVAAALAQAGGAVPRPGR
jgi:thiol-disulfide isomerase/thioredoxin